MASHTESSMVENRAELMKGSPLNDRLNFREAHFLSPSTANSTEGDAPDFPRNFSSLANIDVAFKGWKQPQLKWTTWLENLRPRYQATWERAGIHQALRNSDYYIQQNKDLILGFAERWCSRTQSFVFPWGECSITLEDVMILGSYPVVGNPVFATPSTRQERASAQRLEEVRKELASSSARKASQSAWINYFMDTGSAIEHEAFLAIWLTRFVFPSTENSISKRVLPLAALLARGEKIAFAPAVLAKIYEDLSYLKFNITISNGYERLLVPVWASFHLVQVWVWERFRRLRPEPNFVGNGEPRLARWHGKNRRIENVRFVIDSAQESFYWRPYVAVGNNPISRIFYKENEEMVSIVVGVINEDLESYIRCLRVSELIGMDEECVEQYLPHRVARQFGFDQDIPTHVPRPNIADREAVWRSYTRRIQGEPRLYFPSRRAVSSNVSDRYNRWWLRECSRPPTAGRS